MPKKPKKKQTKTKQITTIDDKALPIDVQDTIETLMAVNKPKKKDEQIIRFHLLRMFGVDTRTSAKLAGYNAVYGYKLVEKYRNDNTVRHTVEKFVSNIPDDYRSLCKLRLINIAEIEGKALAEYDKDPKLAINKPHLLKQLKQAGGVDLNDQVPAPRVQTVEIGALNVFWSNAIGADEPEKIAAAEVVEDE